MAGQRGSSAVRCGQLLLAAAILPVTLAACATAPAAIPATAGSPSSAAPGRTGRAIPEQPAAQHETLTETGSTLLLPLLHAWAGAYQQRFPQVSDQHGRHWLRHRDQGRVGRHGGHRRVGRLPVQR